MVNDRLTRDAMGVRIMPRRAEAGTLGAALQASRHNTLATFAVVEQALPSLRVPYHPSVNPPLWELGHIGWFQAYWIGRNPARHRGAEADPDTPRSPALRRGVDALYDSGRVPHASRWSLPLPDADATRADLAAQLAQTLALLGDAGSSDAELYFYRLALFHEDMHHEAALYMAQALDMPIADARWQPRPLPHAAQPLAIGAGLRTIGWRGPGFAFDNELPAHETPLEPCLIDSQVVRWADYLPFVEAGGYRDARWWSGEGRVWLQAEGIEGPRYLRQEHGAWHQRRFGRWMPLDTCLPACHLSYHEAQAWCRWAGRRLPGEAEWETAALEAGDAFEWGDVWEWTASAFAPYAGFKPHPYRDYSAPWFDGRPVLRGASFATQPRLREARYRNYFPAQRNDIFAGFRSCAT